MRGGQLTGRRAAPIVLSAVLTLVCGLLGASSATAAPRSTPANTPAPYPMVQRLQVPIGARMVFAHGHLFVSEGPQGSAVVVYSTAGKVVQVISGEPGADGLALSPDGATVYVADSAADTISAINAKTYAHTELTVDSCPTYLALANGRLFYSFGCNPMEDSSGLSNIDPSVGGTPVSNLTGLYDPPLLAGAGNTLAEGDVGLQPGHLTTYTSDAAGALTQESTMSVGLPSDLALNSSGSALFTAGGGTNQFTEYATSTLHQKEDFTSGSTPLAVAASPDGTHIVGGMDGTTDLVNLYASANSTPVWQRFGALVSPKSWVDGEADQVLPGSMTFSSDGSHVYALVSASDPAGVFLFASKISTSPTKVHLAVNSPRAGHQVVAAATMPARGEIQFRATSNGKVYTGTASTNSNGVATFKFASPFNGSVQAEFTGNVARYPAVVKQKFTVASKSTLTLSGSYATHHGVQLFRSGKRVRIHCLVLPAVKGRHVLGRLEYFTSGKWHVVDKLPTHLKKNGTVSFKLGPVATHTKEKVTLNFRGDALNTKSEATSPTFEIT